MKKILRKLLATVFAMQSALISSSTAATKRDLSQLPIKSYFLSFESLENLSETDRTAYLLGLSQFLMVREYSQDHFVGKISKNERQPAADDIQEPILDSAVTGPGEAPAPGSMIQSSKATLVSSSFPLMNVFVEKAQALWGLALAGASRVVATSTAVRGALSAARSFLANRFGGAGVMGFLEKKAAQEATKDSAKFAAKVGLGTELGATALAQVTKLRTLGKETIEAKKALEKLKVGSPEFAEAKKAFDQKNRNFTKLLKSLTEGKDEVSKKIVSELNKTAWGKKLLVGAGLTAATTLPFTGLPTAEDLDHLATAATDWFKSEQGPTPTAEENHTNASQGQPAPTETPLVPWEPQEGKGCIYGMRASKWEIKNGKSYCIRPSDTKSHQCQPPGESMYPCPSFGLTTTPEDPQNFCVTKNDLKDLSVRCGAKLNAILDSKNAKITKENYDQFLKEVKFSGSEGEQTLEQYCKGASKTQGTECGALAEILKIFEKSKSISNEVAAAAAPAQAAGSAAPSAPSASAPGTDTPKK